MSKDDKKLIMNIPPSIAEALSRRHHGNTALTREQLVSAVGLMQKLYAQYLDMRSKLDYCEGEWWDKMKIEKHQFSRPARFSYAHRKRNKLMKEVKDLHSRMFYLLVHTDGNSATFDSDAMSVAEIIADFNDKYLTKLTVLQHAQTA